MKLAKRADADFSSSLVDVLFALLGISICFLAAFALQSGKSQDQEFQLRISATVIAIDQVSGLDVNDSNFPVLGCLTVENGSGETVYSNGSRSDCPTTESVGLQSHWLRLYANGVFYKQSLLVSAQVKDGDILKLVLLPLRKSDLIDHDNSLNWLNSNVSWLAEDRTGRSIAVVPFPYEFEIYDMDGAAIDIEYDWEKTSKEYLENHTGSDAGCEFRMLFKAPDQLSLISEECVS